jgi:DNA-binding response OmpR family regulator
VTEPSVIETPPQVLVVDDDEKLAGVIVRALERAGFLCRVAASGDETLWAVQEHSPDALVLDVMIPHPSGVETCGYLRRHGFVGPVIVISGRSHPDDRAAAARAGADRFLAKPFALSELVDALEDELRVRA